MSYRRERGREREIDADDPFTLPDFVDNQETSWRRQRSSNGSVQSFSSVDERRGRGEQDYPRGQSHHGEELVRGGDSSSQRGKKNASDHHRSQDSSWKDRLQFHGRPPDQPHHRRTGSDGYPSTRPSHDEDRSWRDSRSPTGSPRYIDKIRSEFHEGKRDWSPRARSEDSLESHGSSLHGKPSSSVESGELLDRRRRDARRDGRSEQAQVARLDRDFSPRARYRGHSPLSERSSARSQRSERSAGTHADAWDSRRDQAPKGASSIRREVSLRIDEPGRNYSPSRDGRRSSSRDRSPRNDAKSTRSSMDEYVIPRKQVVAPNPPQPPSPLPSSPPRSQRPASGSAPVDPRRRRGRPAPRSNDRSAPVPSRSSPFTHNTPLLDRNTSPGPFRDAAIVSGESLSGEKRVSAVSDESRRSGGLSQSSDRFKSVESDTGDGGYGATARKEFTDQSNVAEDDAESPSDLRYLQTGRDRKARGGEGPPSTADEEGAKGVVDSTESDIERTYTDMIPPSIRAGREPWQNTPVPAPPMGLSIQSITLGGGEEDAPQENPVGIHGVHVRLPLRHQHPTVDPELIPRRAETEDSMQNLAHRHAPASQSHPPAAFGGGTGGYPEYDHGTQVHYPPAPQPLQSVHQSQPPWFDNQRASGAGSTYSDTCRNVEGGFQNGVSAPSTMHSPPVQMAPHPDGFRPLDGGQPNSLYAQDGNTNSFVSLPDTNRGPTWTNNGTDRGATGVVVQVPSDRLSPLPATPQQYPVIQHQAPSQSVPQQVTPHQPFQEQQGYWGGGNTNTSGICSGSQVATMAPALGQTWSHSNVTGSSMVPPEITWTNDMSAGAGAGVGMSGDGPSTIPIQGGQSCPASSHAVGALGGDVVSQQGIEGGTCERGVIGPIEAIREKNPIIAAAATPHSAQANHAFKGEFHPATSGPASAIDSTNGSLVASASHTNAASSSCGAGDGAGPTPAGRQRLAPTPLARTEWSLADLARRFPRLTIPESLIYVVASWVTLDSRSIGVVPLLCQPVLREDEDVLAPDMENAEQDLTNGGQEEEKRGESSAGEGAGRGAENDVVDGHEWEVRVIVPYGLGAEAASGCWGEAFRLALVRSEVCAASSWLSPEGGDGHQERDPVDEEGHATYPGSGASGKLLITLPGGVWDPERDGTDVEADDNMALIRTAVRTSKSLSGLDLSRCSCWLKFCELYHDGRTTIVFLCGDGVRVAPEDAPRNVTVATISELVFGDLRKAAQGRNSAAERGLDLELEATFEARLCAEFLWGLVSRDWAGVVLDSLRTHAASLERMKPKNPPSTHPLVEKLSSSAAGTAADSGAQLANEFLSESAHDSTGDDAPGSREHVSSAGMSTETGGAEAKGPAGGARSSAADAALLVMETPAEVRAAFSLFDLEGQGWVAGDRLEAWLLDAGFRLSTRYLKSLLSSVCSVAEARKNLLFQYRSHLVLSEHEKKTERGVTDNFQRENGGAPGSDDTNTAAAAAGTVAPGEGASTVAPFTADEAPVPASSKREKTSGGDSVDEGACASAAPGKASTASTTTEDTRFTVGSDEAKTPVHDDHRGAGAKGELSSVPTSIKEPESAAIREDVSGVAAKKDSASIRLCSAGVMQTVTASVEESTSTSGNSSQSMKEVASAARDAGATASPEASSVQEAISVKETEGDAAARPSTSTEKSGPKAIKGDVPAPGRSVANSNTVEKNATAPKVAAATVPARSTSTPTSTSTAPGSTLTVSTRNATTKRATSASTASKRPASEVEHPSGPKPRSGSSAKSAKTPGKGSANAGAKRSTPTLSR